MTHPDRAAWSAFVADQLDPVTQTQFESHYSDCADCQAIVAALFELPADPDPDSVDRERMRKRLVIAEATRPTPKTIGDYRIIEPIGSGGMGVVYRVERQSDGATFALKVLHDAVRNDANTRQRFLREIELLRDNAGDGVVEFIDSGEADGSPFVVLEWASGKNLQHRLGDFQLQPDQLARVLQSVARTLARLHERGVIHRDLKPGNILLRYLPSDPNEPIPIGDPPLNRLEAILTDFGLAFQLSDSDAASRHLTSVGAILGTTGYLSPEQARNAHEADARSDIFSLGAVLYSALTGQTPFGAVTLYDTFQRLEKAAPARPSSLNHLAPDDLQRIAMRCLEKDRADRYQTANELADDLERYRKNDELAPATRSYSRQMMFWRTCRRHPWVSGSVSAAGLLLLTATIVSVFWARSESKRATAVIAEEQAKELAAAQDRQRVHSGLTATADAAARRGDWPRAVPLYTQAIANGRDDALELRVRRLPGYFNTNDSVSLERELAELTDGRDLGPLKARVLLYQGDWLMCDQDRLAEGRSLIQKALAQKQHLSDADAEYAEALICEDLRETIRKLRHTLELDRLHARASEVYLFALILVGDFEAGTVESRLHQSLYPNSVVPSFFESLAAAVNRKDFEKPLARLLDSVRAVNGDADAKRVDAFVHQFAVLLRQTSGQAFYNPLQPTTFVQFPASDLGRSFAILNREANGAKGPLIIGLPIQQPIRRFLESLAELSIDPRKWTPQNLENCKQLSRTHPEAMLPMLVMTYHLLRAWPAVDHGKLDVIETELAAAFEASQQVRSSPTLLANLDLPAQALMVDCLCRVVMLKLFPGSAKENTSELLKNLPILARSRDPIRSMGLMFLVQMVVAPPSDAQNAKWDLSKAEVKTQFIERYMFLIRTMENGLDLWDADAKSPMTKMPREALRKAKETIQNTPEKFRFVPGKASGS